MILDEALETLFEQKSLPRAELLPPLLESYGGDLGFAKPSLIANFVTSVDGVVAVADPSESGHIISKGSRADRFVMGLLRALADTVLVGAGTFRKTHGHLFSAEAIFPEAAAEYGELRKRLGLAPRPRFVVLTRSGNIDTAEPVLDGATIVSCRAAAPSLRGRVGPTTEVVTLGADAVLVADAVRRLREHGSEVLLCEGGPTLFAELVHARLVDELFVTTSPALFGRFSNDRRKSLADGLDLGGEPMELVSLKRHGSYLFHRYAFATRRA